MKINRTNSMYCVERCCDLSHYNRSTDNKINKNKYEIDKLYGNESKLYSVCCIILIVCKFYRVTG